MMPPSSRLVLISAPGRVQTTEHTERNGKKTEEGGRKRRLRFAGGSPRNVNPVGLFPCPSVCSVVSLDLVGDPPVLLRPRDAVGGVQAGQHELDARRPHRLIF